MATRFERAAFSTTCFEGWALPPTSRESVSSVVVSTGRPVSAEVEPVTR